jgi:hypothetical protein
MCLIGYIMCLWSHMVEVHKEDVISISFRYVFMDVWCPSEHETR